MDKKTSMLGLAVAMFLLAFPVEETASASVVIDRVVAVVNEDIITLSDLQREETQKRNELKDIKMDERMVLEDMIDRKLQMAAAKKAGMDVTDKELADALADVMKRNSFDTKQFEAALAKEGLSLEQYKQELREQMTLSRMFNKYVRSGVIVDETEVRAYYDRNRSAYTLPEEVRLRQIYFPLPDNATPAQTSVVKARAETVYELARKGGDFLRLVRDNSSDAAAFQDGDLGFMKREHMLPEIQAAAQPLKTGEISRPFLCSGGYHIIRIEEARTPVMPFEKVKDDILNTLYQQKVENTYRSWLQTLRSDSHVENKL